MRVVEPSTNPLAFDRPIELAPTFPSRIDGRKAFLSTSRGLTGIAHPRFAMTFAVTIGMHVQRSHASQLAKTRRWCVDI